MKFLAKLYDKIITLIKQDEFTYKFNWSIIFISLIITIIFYIVGDGDGDLFARSGAILVLFGAIVEYTLSNIKNYDASSDVIINGKKVIIEKELNDTHKSQRILAHFYIFIGTFIWAFGDWMPKSFFL